ncbi:hypothetical protein [Flavimaricola marinus]|nr:hypothetical protein [Flavimaricola marinus]
MSKPVRILLIGLGVLVLAGLALINPIGRAILVTPTAGAGCETPDTVEGLDFRSAFNSENQIVNGSMIRSLRGDPSPDCRRIGNSYRCTQDGPTTVEVRLPGMRLLYEVPEATQATIFGDRRDAFCVITSEQAE